MTDTLDQLSKRYQEVQARIARAATQAGRDPAAVTLVAVTKTWPAAVVIDGYEVGLRHFGENRAEELAEKRAAVEERLGRKSGIVWHLIGPLQSRKTTLAADNADFFHALDRLKIARRLSTRLEESGRVLPVLLEVNISGEESKHGFDMTRWEADEKQRAKLQEVAQAVAALPALQVKGLMSMAPWQVEDEVIASVFRRTRALARWLAEAVPAAEWTALSMGMTDDFELAITEGATHIRVGRALFGPRQHG